MKEDEIMSDLIKRADAIEAVKKRLYETAMNNMEDGDIYADIAEYRIDIWLSEIPSAEATGDLISRVSALEEMAMAECGCSYSICVRDNCDCSYISRIKGLPSADAKPKMTGEVREALMRLTMCARGECGMCKYKDKCGFGFQYKLSTENMHTILDALSAEAVHGEWSATKNDVRGIDVCGAYMRGGDSE
jgi:hypothetical protein